ncbi:uncharacterized protein [Neodiprion pinetum]|uniref:uncharacterized protein n=1 Tax=Neodiprion pinetum TaxID=441929 RepID=UPI00371D7B61
MLRLIREELKIWLEEVKGQGSGLREEMEKIKGEMTRREEQWEVERGKMKETIRDLGKRLEEVEGRREGKMKRVEERLEKLEKKRVEGGGEKVGTGERRSSAGSNREVKRDGVGHREERKATKKGKYCIERSENREGKGKRMVEKDYAGDRGRGRGNGYVGGRRKKGWRKGDIDSKAREQGEKEPGNGKKKSTEREKGENRRGSHLGREENEVVFEGDSSY